MTIDTGITLDVSSWTLRVEVEDYAAQRGIDLGQAIRQLVNVGLSYDH